MVAILPGVWGDAATCPALGQASISERYWHSPATRKQWEVPQQSGIHPSTASFHSILPDSNTKAFVQTLDMSHLQPISSSSFSFSAFLDLKPLAESTIPVKLSPSFQKDSHWSHPFPDVLWPSQPLWSLIVTYKALTYCLHSQFSFSVHPLPFLNPFTKPLRPETPVSWTLPAPKVIPGLFNYSENQYPRHSLSISTSSVFSNVGCWCPNLGKYQNHLGNFVNWRFLGLTPDLQNQNLQGWGLAIWIFLKGLRWLWWAAEFGNHCS